MALALILSGSLTVVTILWAMWYLSTHDRPED